MNRYAPLPCICVPGETLFGTENIECMDETDKITKEMRRSDWYKKYPDWTNQFTLLKKDANTAVYVYH